MSFGRPGTLNAQPISFILKFTFIQNNENHCMSISSTKQSATAKSFSSKPKQKPASSSTAVALKPTSERSQADQRKALTAGAVGATAASFAQREAAVRGKSQFLLEGTPAFQAKMKTHINTLAPGTQFKPAAGYRNSLDIVPAPEKNRVAGHRYGYQLIDQAVNSNKNSIFLSQSSDGLAVASPTFGEALGTYSKPNEGSPVSVKMPLKMQEQYKVLYKNSKEQPEIKPIQADAIALGHELTHATRATRGVMQLNGPTAVVTRNPVKFGDQWFHTSKQIASSHPLWNEEVATVGLGVQTGVTENRLNKELRLASRATFYSIPDLQSGRPPPLNDISAPRAALERLENFTRHNAMLANDTVRSGGKNVLISASLGAGFSALQGRGADQVAQGAGIAAASSVVNEFIERSLYGPRSLSLGITPSNLNAATRQARVAGTTGAVMASTLTTLQEASNLQNAAARPEAVGKIISEGVLGAVSSGASAAASTFTGAAVNRLVPGKVGSTLAPVAGAIVGTGTGLLTDAALRQLKVDQMISNLSANATRKLQGQ
jgi:hypothetical protein